MTQKEFQETRKYILNKAQDIMDAKQPEYTNKSIDVLYNFISTAKSVGIEPMKVWAVFFNKHVQAILTHAGDPNMNQAEPIESRYADAINYLFLGFALLVKDKSKKDVISGTE
tara:strand:+ start:109 stop:447 length:339 start_codon:yes stop_codon:yes gene_type:complete